MEPCPTSTSPNISRQNQHTLLLLSAIALSLLLYRSYGNRLHLKPTSDLPALEWSRIDLNQAEKAELLQLPGVGPSLADAILNQRQARGRFESVDDLNAVRGIGTKTLERLRDRVQVDLKTNAIAAPVDHKVERLERPQAPLPTTTPSERASQKISAGDDKININSASIEALQRLPGIGSKLAERIVSERMKQPFTTVEELRRVSGIGVKTLEKLRPFVICQ